MTKGTGVEKRRFGRTEHQSTIVTFGTAVFIEVSQKDADKTVELVLQRGVNHIDVAPEYGDAEIRMGPWIDKYRNELFLGCKTLMRTKNEAREELFRSLDRLKTDRFDLYQLHSVDKQSELKTAFGTGGAMEAILEAKSQNLLNFIGITSHSLSLLIKALDMFDFDTLMFPFNFIFYADPGYSKNFLKLMNIADRRDIGIMVIKSIAKKNWEEEYREIPILQRPYTTWYQPFDNQDDIERCLRFVLSNEIDTVVSPSDVKLLSMVLDGAERFRSITGLEQEKLLQKARRYKLLEFTFS